LTEHDAMAWVLIAPEERLRMRDLSDRLRIPAGSLTRVVDRLVEQGWLTRHTPPQNRREVHVGLTGSGKATLRKARVIYARTIEDTLCAHLSASDLKALDRITRRLLDGAGLGQFPESHHTSSDVDLRGKAVTRVLL
jgi:DNA-binding MarR family transcriptional regulator